MLAASVGGARNAKCARLDVRQGPAGVQMQPRATALAMVAAQYRRAISSWAASGWLQTSQVWVDRSVESCAVRAGAVMILPFRSAAWRCECFPVRKRAGAAAGRSPGRY